MNKKGKLISTLAVAGLIATTGFASMSNAASVKSYGKYSKLNDLTNAVPYIIGRNEKVTYADLQAEFGNITADAPVSGSAQIGTGDQFESNGKKYTVVIYGDVNGDGIVDTRDARAILNHAAETEKLTGAALEAGNVANTETNAVDTRDARAVLNFTAENTDKVRETAPNGEEEKTAYSLNVENNGVINKDIKTNGIKVSLKAENNAEKDIALTLVAKDSKGVETNLTFNPNTTTWTLEENSNKTKDVTAVVSGLANGNYTFEAKNGNEVLATADVKVAVYTPVASNIHATRLDAKTAALSLEGYGDSKIVKVEYTGDNSKTESIDVTNNKLENAKINKTFGEGEGTLENVVLVDEYGNKSDVQTVNVPKYGATVEKAVSKIEVPVLNDKDATKNTTIFAVTDAKADSESKKGTEAYLYKDGVKVAPITLTDGKFNLNTEINSKNYSKIPGKYSISVINLGDGINSTNSAEVKSAEVEVKELAQVRDLKLNIANDGKYTVTFTDPNAKENEDANAAPYTFTINEISVDADNKETSIPVTPTNTPTLNADKVYEGTGLKANTLYTVDVKVNPASAQYEYLESQKATSEKAFYLTPATIGTPVTADTTDTTLTFNFGTIQKDKEEISTDITLGNEKATYQAKVATFKENKESKNTDIDESTVVTKNVTVNTDADGKRTGFTIEGLNPDTEYAVKLVATIAGKTAESDWSKTENAINAYKTLKTDIAIDNLKVVDNEKDATKGTIYYGKDETNGDIIKVDGTQVATIAAGGTVTFDNYSQDFKDKVELAKDLIAGDVIKVDGKDVTLTLTDKESSDQAITLGEAYEGYNVTVKGNGTYVDRKVTISSAVKALNVEGNKLVLSLTDSNTEKVPVALKDGAEIKNDGTFTVVKGATVTINGVEVNSDKADITVKANGKELTITTAKGLNTNLIFTNLINTRYSDGPATIKFAGADNDSEIAGTATISSKGGSITVDLDATDNKADLSGLKLNVTATENADVEIKDPVITNGKATANVSATYTAKDADLTLTVTPSAKAEKILSDAKVTAFTLVNGEITTATIDGEVISKADDLTEEQKAVINSFVKTLGNNITDMAYGEQKTVTVQKDKTVTLTEVTTVKTPNK